MKLKREHLLIAVVLVIGAALVAFSTIRRGPLATAGSRLRVTSMGEEGINKVVAVRLLEAHVHETIEVPGPLGITVVELDGLRARVISSPCPDKICIKMGWLERPGDYAACLPNRVLAEVLDPTEN